MRLIAVTIVVVAGALLLVAEVAHSFATGYRGGGLAGVAGGILCAAGLIGLFVELYPPHWLRASAARRDDKPEP